MNDQLNDQRSGKCKGVGVIHRAGIDIYKEKVYSQTIALWTWKWVH